MVDNFFTGTHHNLKQHLGKANFELIRHDVVQPILIEARARARTPCCAATRRAQPPCSAQGLGIALHMRP